MVIRLLAGVMVVAVFSVVFACGGSSSSSSTPTAVQSVTEGPMPSPTLPPPNCQSRQLYGALVSDGAAEPRVLTLGIGNTLSTCTLAGPPQIYWYDLTGGSIDDIILSATTGVVCGAGTTDFTACVDSTAITLPGDEVLPAANVDGPVTAVVSVTDTGLCVDPAVVSAHFIGLAFPDTDLDVQIQLPQEVRFLRCASQATLQAYGPSS